MQTFNLIFTPFGIILVLFAVIFSSPSKADTLISLLTLSLQFTINHYISKNIYHFQKMYAIRKILILFNILTTSVVFYFIASWWAPAWLLYTMPAIFGATFLDTKNTLFFSLLSSISMLLVYYIRAKIFEIEISSTLLTMALCHAFFIIAVSFFVNNLWQTLIKIKR